MSARSSILSRITTALGREPVVDPEQLRPPDAVVERLRAQRVLARPALNEPPIELLIERMEFVLMSVMRLQTRDNIVAAVQSYLQLHGINGTTTVAPALGDLPWCDQARVDQVLGDQDSSNGVSRAQGMDDVLRVGAPDGTENTGVSVCLAAVAETGSVVVASSAECPASLNFLPENHIVVVHEHQVVRYIEDVWPYLRALDPLPRALNFLTGPSRTADIEQTLEIGVHGPRRMHVLLVANS